MRLVTKLEGEKYTGCIWLSFNFYFRFHQINITTKEITLFEIPAPVYISVSFVEATHLRNSA